VITLKPRSKQEHQKLYGLSTNNSKRNIGCLTHRRKTTMLTKITGIKEMKATQKLAFGKLNVLCERWGINSEAETGFYYQIDGGIIRKYDRVRKLKSEMQIIRNK